MRAIIGWQNRRQDDAAALTVVFNKLEALADAAGETTPYLTVLDDPNAGARIQQRFNLFGVVDIWEMFISKRRIAASELWEIEFIMAHEIAHMVHNHQGSTIAREFEADKTAVALLQKARMLQPDHRRFFIRFGHYLSGLSNGGRPFEYLWHLQSATHPTLAQRHSAINEQMDDMGVTVIKDLPK